NNLWLYLSGVILYVQLRVGQVVGCIRAGTQEIGKPGQNVIHGGSTKSDGQGNAIVFGNAVVANAGWQVQHVSGCQGVGFFAAPATEYPEWGAINSGRGMVAVAAKGPAPMPFG